jgi:flagellar biosynthesis protein FliR
MNISGVSADAVAAFLLALVRASAWLSISPPFNGRTIPGRVKAALAFALALAVAPKVQAMNHGAVIPLDTGGFIGSVLVQAAVGVTLGFLALMMFSAIQAAGNLIDLFGGFTIDTAYDPLSNAQSSVFGRIHQLLAVTLLFAIDGHLMLVRGFMASFEVLPARQMEWNDLARLVTNDVGRFMVAAAELAGPLVAVLFVSEVAMGMLSKAAPAMNIFQLSFPLKIFITLLLASSVIALMPDAIASVLDLIMRNWGAALRMFPGGSG